MILYKEKYAFKIITTSPRGKWVEKKSPFTTGNWVGWLWHSYLLCHVCMFSKLCIHDDVIKLKHFPCYWPVVCGIPRSPVNSPHKCQGRGPLVFFYLRLNKRLSEQSRRRWFETPSCSLWRHYNVKLITAVAYNHGINQTPSLEENSALQWGHNGRDSVSNHQPHDCFLNRYSGADQRKHQCSA